MHRNRVALTLIVTLLAASPGAASPLDRPWARLAAALWGQAAALDAGCGWDPSGVLRCNPAALANVGCGWDPSGVFRCQPASLDEGIGWDPNGSIGNPPAGLDVGCGWDPDGRCQPTA